MNGRTTDMLHKSWTTAACLLHVHQAKIAGTMSLKMGLRFAELVIELKCSHEKADKWIPF